MEILYRPGKLSDSRRVFQIFITSVMDLGQRLGVMTITGGDDPEVIDTLWQTRRSMFNHLARTADQFWVAELNQEIVGYARAIRRGPVQELTEYFVLPDSQSAGIGRELLGRAFPAGTAPYRAIVATLDERALVRYLKAGVYPRFPLKSFSKAPEYQTMNTDLEIALLDDSAGVAAEIDAVDRQILGHTRPEDHVWIRSQRQGFLYKRRGKLVGYGYVGPNSGPFALLEPDDFPAVLAHAETVSCGQWSRFGVEIPMINTAAVDYLLAAGFRMEAFTAMFMVNQPFGQFENYIFFSPPFII